MKKETLYPRYYIKCYLNGKVVNSLATRKPLRINSRINLTKTNFKYDKVFIKIQYDKKFYNSGVYTNYKDLIHAFTCFKEIVKEFK